MPKLYERVTAYLRKLEIDDQVLRYIITGVMSNGIGYLFYLTATLLLNIGHKTAMTGLYAIGVMVNFSINRRWTFRSIRSVRSGLLRFLLAIVVGYFLNLILLFTCVDFIGWPHQFVQAGAIMMMAIYFFIINKHYVHAA